MPQGVDNRFNSGINAPLSRSLPSARSETPTNARDLFQKALDSSRQKVREPEAQPEPKRSENYSKSSTRSKRAESTSRRRRPDAADDAATDQPEQSDSAAETTDDVTPPVDTDTTAEAQPAKSEDETKDAAESPDAVAQAINAAQQNAVQAQSAAPNASAPASVDNSDHTADETTNPLVALKSVDPKANPASLQKVADKAQDPSANAAADANSEEEAVQAGFQIPADTAAPESADSSKVISKLKKVPALGETKPPNTDEALKGKSAVSQGKPQSAIQALSAADVLAQLADPDFSADATDDGDSPIKPLTDAVSADPNSAAPAEPSATKTSTPDNVRVAAQPPAPREVDFADTNHDRIVTSLKSQLMPNGGTMHMRLDPPELGVLQITVKMQDGVMTASFETSNSDATKLLSHSLGQLKAALESQGVSVEKLHVQESPSNQQSSADDQQNQQSQQGDQSARQEQQRREMLKRMWRRLGIGSDPLDMVA